MRNKIARTGILLRCAAAALATAAANLAAQDADGFGTLRTQVVDADWEAPLSGASVTVVELERVMKSGEDGTVLFNELPFGEYNLLVSAAGFERQLMRGVVINPGTVQQVVVRLAPVYTDMDELVVRDFDVASVGDTVLIELKMESTASFDAVSADTISRAGASDAASALKLVSGATVQDGKYAVIRGLPDRYVNSQLNGVRLPSADADKRAVQLDQFPSAMIESIRVTKTFMPDQQGDATGGAVDIRLKRIPDKFIAKVSVSASHNDQVTGEKMLAARGPGLSYWGDDRGDRARPFRVGAVEQPENSNLSPYVWNRRMTEEDRQRYLESWQTSASQTAAFNDNYRIRYRETEPGTSWNLTLGEVFEPIDDVRFGFLGNFSYKHNYAGYNDGVLNRYMVRKPDEDEEDNFTIGRSNDTGPATYRVREGQESILWGGALTTGFESPWLNIGLTYLRSQATDETVTMIEDRSQLEDNKNMWRQQSVHYSERTTETTLLEVEHPWFFLPEEMDVSLGRDWLIFLPPVTDWSISRNMASQYEPDRALFTEYYNNGYWKPPTGNLPPLERKWRDIEENGRQYLVNQKIPFRIYSGDEGYLKGGYFEDQVRRSYQQDTFEYREGNVGKALEGDPDDMWSDEFITGYPALGPPGELEQGWYIAAGDDDIDYNGQQDIRAWYWMADVPLASFLAVQGGIRVESTEINARMKPSKERYDGNFAVWSLKQNEETGSKYLDGVTVENDEELNAHSPDLERNDRLPALGMRITPLKNLNLRLNWSETVARPTFKELMPVRFKESAAADTYLGNPDLEMSEIENYDLRLEYMPSAGQLLSVSYFYKELLNPIDLRAFSPGGGVEGERFIMPYNYPEGEISGWEFEARQDIGQLWSYARGLTLGFNSTLMESEVVRPADEFQQVQEFGAERTRRMAGQPEYILGTYAIYDIEDWGTSLGLFFNRRGDVLAVGDSVDNGDEYTPCIYEEPLEQLDFTISQRFLKRWTVGFKIKNLLNPKVKRVYRMEDGNEALRSSYRRGREYSISLACEW
jgi:outer membrane receptor protein involved in Fe transport